MQCLLESWAKKRPHAIALKFEGRQWSWEELHAWASAWEEELSSRKIQPGEGVGVLAFNRPDTVALFHACARLGLRLVLLNARLTQHELSVLGQLSSLKLCFADEMLLEKFPGAEIFPQLALTQLAPTRLAPTAYHAVSSNDSEENIAATLFTSGTTGTPKRVDIRHRHLLAHAAASAANLGGDTRHTWHVCLQMFHIGGLVNLGRCALYGATLSLASKFDVEALDAEVEAGKITHLSLVPTMLSRWVEHRQERPIPKGMEVCLLGGEHVPLPLFVKAKRMGIPVLCSYGLTEACSQAATEALEMADGRSCGFPLPGVEIRISKEEMGEGGVGEIELRGKTILIAEGWLKTGDFGRFDAQGRLVVLSRRVDLIISGGENIYPAEVERVLLECEGVVDAAVGAHPSERWGQVPVALVVLREAVLLDTVFVETVFVEEVLLPHCRQHLAGYKIPKAIFAVEELPRNAAGKINRRKLQEVILQRLASSNF